MPLAEQFLGDVWDVDLADFGIHPALALSVNRMNRLLGHVADIPTTGTRGSDLTHIPLTADAGLTRYDESYFDVTALQPVDRSRLLQQRGRLAPTESPRLVAGLTVYLAV